MKIGLRDFCQTTSSEGIKMLERREINKIMIHDKMDKYTINEKGYDIHFVKDETIKPYKLILEVNKNESETALPNNFWLIDEFKTINDITQELNKNIQLRTVYLNKMDCDEKFDWQKLIYKNKMFF